MLDKSWGGTAGRQPIVSPTDVLCEILILSCLKRNPKSTSDSQHLGVSKGICVYLGGSDLH